MNRLTLATVGVVISFMLIALVLLGTFYKVQSDVGQVIQTEMQQTVENSRISRALAQFLARQRSMGLAIVGHVSYQEAEGEELQWLLHQLTLDVRDRELQSGLEQLQVKFADYLGQYRLVTSLEGLRHDQVEDINQTLPFLEGVVADRMIETALQGGNVAYLEQLTMLISGYRMSMLEIAKLSAEENHQEMLNGSFSDPPPLADELAGLILRLRTLTASEPPLDRFGRHLIGQVEYLQFLLKRYQRRCSILDNEPMR